MFSVRVGAYDSFYFCGCNDNDEEKAGEGGVCLMIVTRRRQERARYV